MGVHTVVHRCGQGSRSGRRRNIPRSSTSSKRRRQWESGFRDRDRVSPGQRVVTPARRPDRPLRTRFAGVPVDTSCSTRVLRAGPRPVIGPNAFSWLVGSGRRAPVALSGRKGAPRAGPSVHHNVSAGPCLPLGRPGDDHEAYFSTQCPASCEEARLPCSHEHPCRPEHHQEPPRQGPRPTLGLIQRIHGRHAFGTLSRDGRRIRRSSLWCTWCPQPSSNATRVAYSIGRACGPAVTRNRLRRRLREIVRELDRRDELPGGLLLIGARPSAVELTFDQLRSETEQLLRTAITSTSTS